ncbi:MAG: hypothetical protein JXR45_05310 [Deltaproteobacteria bacterium]|nr:hypothetical protein [Deltaproteobacteria bacterium]
MHPVILVFCVFFGFMETDDRMGCGSGSQNVTLERTGFVRCSVVSESGRIFAVTRADRGLVLEEIREQGERTPYPDAEWNRTEPAIDPVTHFMNIRCIIIDEHDCLWILDGGAATCAKGAKLVQISLAENRVSRLISLDDVVLSRTFNFETMRIDSAQQTIYITDTQIPELLVVDLEKGTSHLEQHI